MADHPHAPSPTPTEAAPKHEYWSELVHWFLRTAGLLPHLAFDALLLVGWFFFMHMVHHVKHSVTDWLGGDLEEWEKTCLTLADYIMAYGTLAIVLICIVFHVAHIGRREWRYFRSH